MDAALSALLELAQPARLLMVFIGAGCGLLIGAIPGLSGIVGMALLVPFTYQLDPYSAIALLLAMGSVTTTSDTVTAVLFGVPGTVGSAATVVDGHPMAKRGQAERAFGAAFSASLIGGLFGAAVLAALLPILQPWVRQFGSPELFAISIFGLSMVASLSVASPLRGVMAVSAGLIVSFIALDNQTATERWTSGTIYLWEGVPIVPLFLGLFAIPELHTLMNQDRISNTENVHRQKGILRGIRDTLTHLPLVFRSGALGSVLGTIPGIGAAVIDWIAYGHAKRTVKNSESFGQGDVRGVIAPESANNAKEGGALVPTIAFGIPGSASMTILIGALMVQGLSPGPKFLTDHIDITYLMVFTIVLANIIGTCVCLGASRYFARVAAIPSATLVPVVLLFVVLGAFQANRDVLDFVVLLVFGLLGLAMKASGWSRPAFALGFVLGPSVERYFFISHSIFEWAWLTRPLVAVLFALALAAVLRGVPGWMRAVRQRGTAHDSVPAKFSTLATCAALAVGLAGYWSTLDWPADAASFPRIVLLVMSAAALVSLAAHFYQEARQPKDAGADVSATKSAQAVMGTAKRGARVLLFTVMVPFLVLTIGVVPGTIGFLVAAKWINDRQLTWRWVAISVAVAAFVWLLFDKLLTIPWPEPLLKRIAGI